MAYRTSRMGPISIVVVTAVVVLLSVLPAPDFRYSAGSAQSFAGGTGRLQSVPLGSEDVGPSHAQGTPSALDPSWTNVTWIAPPPGKEYMSMTYDAADQEVVMFGGLNDAAYPTNDTWVFKGGLWYNITSTAGNAPLPSYGMSMAYDAADGYVVAWGGTHFVSSCAAPFPDCNGTWIFQGGKWSLLPGTHTPPGQGAGSSSPMVYDETDGYVLLLDITRPPVQTWTFHAGVWTQLDPTGTANGSYAQPDVGQFPSMAYDPGDGYVVLFGGYDVTGGGCPGVNLACNETWKFSTGNWTELSPSVSPPPRYSAALTYDEADGYLLMFGGANYTTTYGSSFFNDTWKFSAGDWTELSPSSNPGPRYGAGMVFDQFDNVTVFFGGSAVGGSLGQDNTWEWCSHPTGPPPLAVAAQGIPAGVDASSASSVGSFVVSGGFAQTLPPYYDTFVSFGDGTVKHNVSLVKSYLSSGYAEYTSTALVHTYSGPGNFTVEAWANDTSGESVNTSWTVRVASALSVTLTTSNGTPIIGQSILINATVKGGHAPFGYSYSGLPFGCYSVNSSSIGCLPTQAGNFTVRALVNDSWGGSATGTMNIDVVFGFTVLAPTSTVVGHAITIVVQVPANVGTVSYSYSNLPSGCATEDAPQLSCIPNAVGTFPVEITAVSSLYGPAHKVVTIQVTSSSGTSGQTFLGLPVTEGYAVLGAIIVAAAVVAALMIWSSRQKRRANRVRPARNLPPPLGPA